MSELVFFIMAFIGPVSLLYLACSLSPRVRELCDEFGKLERKASWIFDWALEKLDLDEED